ncbi:uncharacterized protein LOC130613943 [Hydractinia symbiolongicarpus]|uniref:uncharacterized protein LOC130613943 n=1 Tax=Hydractinia symbiolongicarpus TaxID=13093 RepID=UPI00255006CD|nr:uncharacterized protein LOC130613943 [Hydractinia symbiolongicarpus]
MKTQTECIVTMDETRYDNLLSLSAKYINDIHYKTSKCTINHNCKTNEHFAYVEYPGFKIRYTSNRSYNIATCGGKLLPMFKKGEKKRSEKAKDIVLKKCQCECQKKRPEEFYDIFLASSVKSSAEYQRLRGKNKDVCESYEEEEEEYEKENKSVNCKDKVKVDFCVTDFNESNEEPDEIINNLSNTAHSTSDVTLDCNSSVKSSVEKFTSEEDLKSHPSRDFYQMEVALITEDDEDE